MPYTLGKKGCPHCQGRGVFDIEPVKRLGFDGKERIYPQVQRCSCLELKPEESPKDIQDSPTPTKPDAAQRAAGERED